LEPKFITVAVKFVKFPRICCEGSGIGCLESNMTLSFDGACGRACDGIFDCIVVVNEFELIEFGEAF